MTAGPPDRSSHPGSRRRLDADDLARARRIIDLAWGDLPAAHRALLEAIGADQRKVVDRRLGREITDLRRSGGVRELDEAERRNLDQALGAWVPDLRLVLIDAGHEVHAGLDETSYEAALARVAWHEWGHALSLDRATEEDIEAGAHLLELAPVGVAEIIRSADYRSRERTHELVAEIYALLMARRRRGQTGQPAWLADEIWSLMRRLVEWSA